MHVEPHNSKEVARLHWLGVCRCILRNDSFDIVGSRGS